MTDSLVAGELRRRVGTQSRDSAPAPARTLLDVFAATVVRCGERTAIDAPDGCLTYDELADAAQALGERLRESGVGPGDRVGVRIPGGAAELYIAILGTLHAGASYVPVDADDPPARAELIWRESGACAVLGAGLTIDRRSESRGRERALTVDDEAWVIFTSGSTGRPKGVAITHRAAAAFVDAEAGLWAVDPDDRVLAGLSVAFDASCEEIWLAWRNGAALVPAPREIVRAGADLGPWLADRGVTVVSTVPTLAAMLDESHLSSVRLLIVGGEACPEPLAWRLAAGREVWNTYGPTEATVVSTAARLEPGKPVTIGWPLRGWETAIVNRRGAPVAIGEPGELVVAGVGLGRYLDPALDATAFAPLPALGWDRAYRTGDIVRETIDGLQFVGRRDDQVKLGGRRIELGEVEAHLNAVAGVQAAAATVQRTAAGNPILVGYVVARTNNGELVDHMSTASPSFARAEPGVHRVEPSEVRAAVAEHLPHGVAPVVIALDRLPTGRTGKVDRKALPWPPPAPAAHLNGSTAASAGPLTEKPAAPVTPAGDAPLTGTAAWLADRWREQLGPLPIDNDSDFFELGGSSVAAAKLVSTLRKRYPAIAVADLYEHRRLHQLAARLESTDRSAASRTARSATGHRRWGAVQLAGLAALVALTAPQWLLGILAVNQVQGGHIGPEIGWGWLIAGWLVFGSATGRAGIVVLAKRLLLPRLAPGRYARRSWLSCRIWFLERLAESYRSEALAGTPAAARFARMCGHSVAPGVRLGALPPVTSVVSIDADATVEADVDLHGWWLEGDELVVGEIRIGAGARVGARTLLAPGAEVGAGAEIEPGTVINGRVPAGERWAGSPGRRVGEAGHSWPAMRAPRPPRARGWQAMYWLGLAVKAMLPLAAAVPPLALLLLTGSDQSYSHFVDRLLVEAPAIAAGFIVAYALLVALLVRAVGRLVRPGYHPDQGRIGWAVWFSESLMLDARGILFSLYSSVFTRGWLRLAGVPVGKRAEVSTVVGANRLTSFGPRSFIADDVALTAARARAGWLHVAPIEVGAGTFLGNGAILDGDTTLGDGCLIGVLSTAPRRVADGTSWLGNPPLELPRVPDRVDPARTVSPPVRLRLARTGMDLIRIVLPATISVVLAGLVYWALHLIGHASSLLPMVLAAPLVLFAAGIVAVALTVAAKWLVMGRYRAGEHPLWSFFVWRDEILNSLQDQLAGTWLLGLALATPLMPVYLRAMGTKVGRDVWCDTLTITEFDMVSLGDGCVINRFACVETHLFHDRLMRIGPARLGAGSTLGVACAVLPDTVLGDGAIVGGRSVVLRGEELPAGTSWHGAPVRSV